MEKKNTQMTVRLSDQLLEKLKVLASDDDRSLNGYIARALQQHVDAKEQPPAYRPDPDQKLPAPPSRTARVQRSIVKRAALKK